MKKLLSALLVMMMIVACMAPASRMKGSGARVGGVRQADRGDQDHDRYGGT